MKYVHLNNYNYANIKIIKRETIFTVKFSSVIREREIRTECYTILKYSNFLVEGLEHINFSLIKLRLNKFPKTSSKNNISIINITIRTRSIIWSFFCLSKTGDPKIIYSDNIIKICINKVKKVAALTKYTARYFIIINEDVDVFCVSFMIFIYR